jgi:hypothetical protein
MRNNGEKYLLLTILMFCLSDFCHYEKSCHLRLRSRREILSGISNASGNDCKDSTSSFYSTGMTTVLDCHPRDSSRRIPSEHFSNLKGSHVSLRSTRMTGKDSRDPIPHFIRLE